MANLQTNYMGLQLSSPLVPSASPLSEKLDNLKRMEDAGAGAVVMFSLFEEQIKQEQLHYWHMMERGSHSFPEAMTYFPEVEDYPVGLSDYLELLREASEALSIPVIASLNGSSPDGWSDVAEQMEQAGARGLELNIFHLPTDLNLDGRAVEERYLEILRMVKAKVEIPVAVKLNPYFSGMANMARRFSDAGADGLVLFNRFYEPDFDIEHLTISRALELSRPSEARLPLLWIGVLHGKIQSSLAATTGVHTAEDLIKYLLAGADVAMTASALLKHGIDHLATMLEGLERWMEMRGFHSVEAVRGLMSQGSIAAPGEYERANYIRMLKEYR